MTDALDGTATEVGSELVPHEQHDQPPTTLFRTDDPVEIVAQASKVADALKNVIDAKGLSSVISGRAHVRVEGWQTLGAMLGVVPVVVWTRELPNGNGWEARVEARTLDGRVVGAAEAMCSKDERTWKTRDPYALRSMAQTRATSKALRGPLGFVVTLAGYDATPAEEIPAAGDSTAPPVARQVDTGLASASDTRLIYDQASGHLNGRELLAVLLRAQDKPAPDLAESVAIGRIGEAIKTLPAEKVPSVLQAIRDVRDGDLS